MKFGVTSPNAVQLILTQFNKLLFSSSYAISIARSTGVTDVSQTLTIPGFIYLSNNYCVD